MTDLLGCTVTHMSLSGVIGEWWHPTFRAIVRGVDADMASLLVQVTEALDDTISPPVGTLLRVATMGGSKERLTIGQDPPKPPVAKESAPEAEVH